ncbi:hypothetical protein KIPB_013959, partial [Kipferlia bialata]|eukprot:g13959.t1
MSSRRPLGRTGTGTKSTKSAKSRTSLGTTGRGSTGALNRTMGSTRGSMGATRGGMGSTGVGLGATGSETSRERRIVFPNGNSYEGPTKRGQMHGRGRYEFAD